MIMNIKFQSNSISFKELAEQHPDNSILVPDSHGLDGTNLFQILVPFALDVIKDVVAYIAKMYIENKKAKKTKAESIIIILKDGYSVQIPITEFDDTESVIRRIVNEAGKINN